MVLFWETWWRWIESQDCCLENYSMKEASVVLNVAHYPGVCFVHVWTCVFISVLHTSPFSKMSFICIDAASYLAWLTVLLDNADTWNLSDHFHFLFLLHNVPISIVTDFYSVLWLFLLLAIRTHYWKQDLKFIYIFVCVRVCVHTPSVGLRFDIWGLLASAAKKHFVLRCWIKEKKKICGIV